MAVPPLVFVGRREFVIPCCLPKEFVDAFIGLPMALDVISDIRCIPKIPHTPASGAGSVVSLFMGRSRTKSSCNPYRKYFGSWVRVTLFATAYRLWGTVIVMRNMAGLNFRNPYTFSVLHQQLPLTGDRLANLEP